MNKKERIRELENEILELKARIRVLESNTYWIYKIPDTIKHPHQVDYTITCGSTVPKKPEPHIYQVGYWDK